MARRKLMMNQTIFCLRVPGVGVLLHPRHPDTTTFTGEGGGVERKEQKKRRTLFVEVLKSSCRSIPSIYRTLGVKIEGKKIFSI